MKKHRCITLISLLLLLSFLLAGCAGGESADTDTSNNQPAGDIGSESTGDTSSDDDDSQSGETSPAFITIKDEEQDALDCATGEAPDDLSDLNTALDLTNVFAEKFVRRNSCSYHFELELGNADEITDPLTGVISILPLDFSDQIDPEAAYPDAVGRMVFTWRFSPGENKELRLFIERVEAGGMGIVGLEDDRYSVEIDGDTFRVDIPCDLVPEGSGWYASIADEPNQFCDLVGYTPGSTQSLELPVEEE